MGSNRIAAMSRPYQGSGPYTADMHEILRVPAMPAMLPSVQMAVR